MPIKPTDFDVTTLLQGQLDALRCPVCKGMLVKPVQVGSKGLVCPTAGHTGLIQELAVQERFLSATPKAMRDHDPQWAGHRWNYAIKRCEEHWQEPEALKRAKELMKKRKGKKP